jgi:hypothetical protein
MPKLGQRYSATPYEVLCFMFSTNWYRSRQISDAVFIGIDYVYQTLRVLLDDGLVEQVAPMGREHGYLWRITEAGLDSVIREHDKWSGQTIVRM